MELSEYTVGRVPRSRVTVDPHTEGVIRDFRVRIPAFGSDQELLAHAERLARSAITDWLSTPNNGEASAFGALCAARHVPCDDAVGTIVAVFAAIVHALPALQDGVPDRDLAGTLSTLQRASAAQTRAVINGYETSLLDRIIALQAKDSRRMAREVHDCIGNNVSLAARNLDLYEIYQDAGRPDAEDKLAAARGVLDGLLHDTRRLVTDLRLQHPVVSLARGLRAYLLSVDPDRIAVDIVIEGDEGLLPGHHKDEVFLILRESLRNVMSHARADNVVVLVEITARQLHARIEDDGVGFDPDVTMSLNEDSSGLLFMRERAELLGGTFSLSSTPGHGTRLELWIPLLERTNVDHV